MSISAIIHTHNSAATLRQALRSVAWADEVIVIDMESTDDTVEIAHKAKARVVNFKLHHYVEPARNFGIKQAKSDWVLILDADEEISETLHQKLLEIAQNPSADAYFLPRQNWVFGYAMRHTGWWPDYQMRFFRQGLVDWPPTVHAQPIINGTTQKLAAEDDLAIIHHNYPTVESFIERLDRYTSIKAAEESKAGLAGVAPRPFKAFGEEFLRRYFAQEGWKDQSHGASLSLLQGIYEVVVQLKMWEKDGCSRRRVAEEEIKDLELFHRQLEFWLADWHVQHNQGWRRWWWQLRRKWQR